MNIKTIKTNVLTAATSVKNHLAQAAHWVAASPAHIAITASTAAAAVAVVVGVAVALPALNQTDAPEPETTTVHQVTSPDTANDTDEAVTTSTITVTLTPDVQPSADATPAIVHITGENTDLWRAVATSETPQTSVELDPGTYSIEVTSPLDTDGSAYNVNDAGTVVSTTDVTTTDDTPETKVDVTSTHKAATEVSEADTKTIADQVDAAASDPDSGITDEDLDKLANNVKANPNVSPETAAAIEEQAKATEANSPATNAGASNDAGGSSQSSSNGGTGSTRVIHHDAEYTTVHHDAEYKNVHHDGTSGTPTTYTTDIEGYIELGPYSSYEDASAAYYTWFAEHKEEAVEHNLYNFQVKTHPGTAGTSARDETVLVKDAWDETVLVKDAWDETVTN